MSNKIQTMIVSFLSFAAALFLGVAGAFELSRNEYDMAIMIFAAMVCALIIAWQTRRPYDPRIVFDSKGFEAKTSKRR